MISFSCPVCSQNYTVSAAKAGKRTACRECQEPLVVPQQEVSVDGEVIPEEVDVISPPTPPTRAKMEPVNPSQRRLGIWAAIVISGTAIVLVAVTTIGNRSNDRGFTPSDPVKSITITPSWSPELVAELKKYEETALHLLAEDRKVREALPRLARAAKDALTLPKTNIQRRFQELDIDRDFEAKRVAWKEKTLELQARFAAGLLGVVRKYGPDDKKLHEEYSRLVRLLSPMNDPWPVF